MLNQIVLVGRIADLKSNSNKESGKTSSTLTLACSRSYKNIDGIYETDLLKIELYNGLAQNTAEYCKKGDLVGIKGRVETIKNKMVIIADKLTFLSSRKESDGE